MGKHEKIFPKFEEGRRILTCDSFRKANDLDRCAMAKNILQGLAVHKDFQIKIQRRNKK